MTLQSGSLAAGAEQQRSWVIGSRARNVVDGVAYRMNTRQRIPPMFDQPRYDKLCSRYGRIAVDDALESVESYCAAKGKKYKNHVAAAHNFMKRAGVASLPGYGIAKKPAAPTWCECNGKVKSTHDEALCMTCGRQWRLLNDLWVEVAEVVLELLATFPVE